MVDQTDTPTAGKHKEAFRVNHWDYIIVMETPDGHLYPMGGRHDCDHRNCPARYDGAPATTLGTAGPIEKMWDQFAEIPPQEALRRWRKQQRGGDDGR